MPKWFGEGVDVRKGLFKEPLFASAKGLRDEGGTDSNEEGVRVVVVAKGFEGAGEGNLLRVALLSFLSAPTGSANRT